MSDCAAPGTGVRIVEPEAPLSDAASHRYRRTIALAGFGPDAQRRLRAARVCVVGAGGLGSAALPFLAGAGVGTLGIVDHDTVEVANLHRQTLYGETDVGRSKVAAALARLRGLNSGVTLTAHDIVVDDDSAEGVLGSYDVILDCTDNVASRLVLADACARLDRPVVWGAVSGAAGQVTVFWASRGYALRDLWPADPHPVPLDEAGVLGPLVGVVGAQQAAEAIKLITGTGEPLLGRVWFHDALAGRSTEVAWCPDPTH